MSRRNANRTNSLPHVRTRPPLTRAQSGAGASESSAAAPSAPSSTSSSAADEGAPLPGGAVSGAGTNKGNLTAEMLGVTKDEIKTAVQLLFVESSGGEGEQKEQDRPIEHIITTSSERYGSSEPELIRLPRSSGDFPGCGKSPPTKS